MCLQTILKSDGFCCVKKTNITWESHLLCEHLNTNNDVSLACTWLCHTNVWQLSGKALKAIDRTLVLMFMSVPRMNIGDALSGERFAVRNSLAEAVVEGAGDHCCEYMTGGCIVVLGKVGRNVGAGMTGGLGYFLDEAGTFLDRVNGEIVRSKRIESAVGEKQLRDLIELHVDRTGSAKGQEILNKWDEMLPKFWQVVPPSEAGSPEVIGNETQPAEIAIAA